MRGFQHPQSLRSLVRWASCSARTKEAGGLLAASVLLGNLRDFVIKRTNFRAPIDLLFVSLDYAKLARAQASEAIANEKLPSLLVSCSRLIGRDWRIAGFQKYVLAYKILDSSHSIDDSRRAVLSRIRNDPTISEFVKGVAFSSLIIQPVELASHTRIEIDSLLLREWFCLAVAAKAIASGDLSEVNFCGLGIAESLEQAVASIQTKYTDKRYSASRIAEILYAVPLTVRSSDIVSIRDIARTGNDCQFSLRQLLYFDKKFTNICSGDVFDAYVKQFDSFDGAWFCLADIHDMENGVAAVCKSGNCYQKSGAMLTTGALPQFFELSLKFIEGELDGKTLLEMAFELRGAIEVDLSDCLSVFGSFSFTRGQTRIPAFYSTMGDGVEGFASSAEEMNQWMRLVHQNVGWRLRCGCGMARISAGQPYYDTFEKAKFALHVTKLFKGTDEDVERVFAFGSCLSDRLSNEAISLMYFRLAEGKPKFAIDLKRYKDEWLRHLKPSKHSEFTAILAGHYK